MVLRTQRGLGIGGVSGELIELSAEGARRKPNLSGKRTEYEAQPIRVEYQ